MGVGAAATPTSPTVTPIEAVDEAPRVGLSPGRFEPQAAGGGIRLSYHLTVRNTFDEPVELTARAIPMKGSSRSGSFAEPAPSGSIRAKPAAWVTFPGFGPGDRRTVPAHSELAFTALVTIPDDVVPGTHAVGFGVAQRISTRGVDNVDVPASRVRVEPTVASVAVIRIPGAATAEAEVLDVTSPRIVWSGTKPEFQVRVRNVGDTDLLIDGRVELDSLLGIGRTIDADGPDAGYPTLPDGVRELRVRWTEPPLLGWFRPEYVVVGGTGSGVRISDDLPPVFVVPPWWMVAALVVALLVPFVRRWRHRRDPHWIERDRERSRARVEQRLARDDARRRAADARRRR